ncbi:MAG: flagellar basal body rod protein FlgB [Lachnospiraceae bacterium]|nr:flagellar basal body rod protein FlgB [Lachnospiraceae bacterium]
MINSNIFNHINMLKTTSDASWRRNEVLANNIANNTTPGYKRKDINFEEQLRREMKRNGSPRNLNLSRLDAKIYTDNANFSYRLDGNNVDVDTEGVKLAANQLKYNGLIEIMNRKFSGLRSVMQK